MRLVVMATVAATLIGGPAWAQDPAKCAKFADAIETGARNLAWVHARSSFASSQIEVSRYASEEANIMALLRLNIEMASANKCQLPAAPVTRGGFIDSLKACKSSMTDAERVKNCSGWVFNPAAPEPVIEN